MDEKQKIQGNIRKLNRQIILKLANISATYWHFESTSMNHEKIMIHNKVPFFE